MPAQMTRAELREGYFRVLGTLYEPENYFERTEALFLNPDFEIGYGKLKDYWRKHPDAGGSRPSRSTWRRRQGCMPG